MSTPGLGQCDCVSGAAFEKRLPEAELAEVACAGEFAGGLFADIFASIALIFAVTPGRSGARAATRR